MNVHVKKTSDTPSAALRILAFREHISREIALRCPPWVTCRDCRELCHPDEFDSVYRGRCHQCGSGRLDHLFRRLAHARGPRQRRAALRAIKEFAFR